MRYPNLASKFRTPVFPKVHSYNHGQWEEAESKGRIVNILNNLWYYHNHFISTCKTTCIIEYVTFDLPILWRSINTRQLLSSYRTRIETWHTYTACSPSRGETRMENVRYKLKLENTYPFNGLIVLLVVRCNGNSIKV